MRLISIFVIALSARRNHLVKTNQAGLQSQKREGRGL